MMSNNDTESFFSVDDTLDLSASLDAENKTNKTNKSNFKPFLSVFEYYLRQIESKNKNSETILWYINALDELKSKIKLESNSVLQLRYNNILEDYKLSADENFNNLENDNGSVVSDIDHNDFGALDEGEDESEYEDVSALARTNSTRFIIKNLNEALLEEPVYIFANLSTHEYKSSADSRQKHTQTILETGIPLTPDQTNLLYQKGGTQVFEPFTDHPYQLKFQQLNNNEPEETHQATLKNPNLIDEKILAHTIINMIENILAQGNGRLNINTNDEKSAYIAHTYFSFLTKCDDPNELKGIAYNNQKYHKIPSDEHDKYNYMDSIFSKVVDERYSNNLHDMFWFKSAVKASTDKLRQDDDYSSSPSLRR